MMDLSGAAAFNRPPSDSLGRPKALGDPGLGRTADLKKGDPSWLWFIFDM